MVRFLPPLFVLALIAAVAAEDLPSGGRFVLEYEGVPVGTSEYRRHVDSSGAVEVTGRTTMRLRLSRGDTLLTAERQSLYDPLSGIIRTYRLDLQRGDESFLYECSFEGASLHLHTRIGEKESTSSRELPEGAVLVDYNAPEHFEFLLRGRTAGASQGLAPCFLPEMMSVLPVPWRRRGEEDVIVDGEAQRGLRFDLSALGMAYRIWVHPETGALLRVAVPGQGLVAYRTQRDLATLRLETADLLRSFHIQPTFAPGQEALAAALREPPPPKRLVLRLDLLAGVETTRPDALTNSHQTFEGEVEEGRIRGTVTIHPVPLAGAAAAAPLPVLLPRAELLEYLAPSPGIEVDDPAIRALAARIVPPRTRLGDAVTVVCRWVHDEVRYENLVASAAGTLQGLRGDCLSKTRLAAALLRGRGVPCRVLGGLSLGRGGFGQHHWLEVHTGRGGWIQVDPTYGQSEGIAADHLDLWGVGVIDTSGGGTIEILSGE